MTMKSRLFSSVIAAALLAAAMPAHAQFVQSNNGVRASTYAASGVGIAVAATATDIFTLKGSASKLVTVTSVDCSGSATASGVAIVQLVKRSTANTGGTSSAPTVVPFDSGIPAGTAALAAYTANPSALGTSVGTLGVKSLGLSLLATGSDTPDTLWNFVQGNFSRPVVLRGVGQSLSVNAGGVATLAGETVSCTFTWTEQ